MTRSAAPEPAAPPWTLNEPVLTTTARRTPDVEVTARTPAAVTVEWPRTRTSGVPLPPPPRVIRLPAREQRSVRGPVPVPAFLAAELIRLHPRPNPRA